MPKRSTDSTMDAVLGRFVERTAEGESSGMTGLGGLDVDPGAVEREACFGRTGGGLVGADMGLSVSCGKDVGGPRTSRYGMALRWGSGLTTQ